MKKTLKKIIPMVFAVLTIGSTTLVSSSAYVWHSDSDHVYRYQTEPNVRVRAVGVTSTFTREYVEGLFMNAVSDWDSGNYAVGSNFISSGSGDIDIYAATPQALVDKYAISFVGSNGKVLNGMTSMGTSLSKTTTVTVGTSQKTVRTKTSTKPAKIYFANKMSAGSLTYDSTNVVSYDARSATGLQNTAKHELGHALGFSGHNLNSGDLMYKSTSNTNAISPSNNDRLHISQFKSLDSSSTSSVEFCAEATDQSIVLDADKLSLISASAAYNDVIIGTPVEILDGSHDELNGYDECEILITDYLFKVSDDKFGSKDEQFIIVRSQAGNCFEIGKEYAISAMHLNNELWDIYILSSKKLLVENTYENAEMLDSLLNADTIFSNSCVSSNEFRACDNAEYTWDFLSNVDYVVDVTINEITESDTSLGVYEVGFNINEIIKGDPNNKLLNEYVMLKGNIEAGERYILLFNDRGDYLMPASRNGSVINANCANYSMVVDIFDGNERED